MPVNDRFPDDTQPGFSGTEPSPAGSVPNESYPVVETTSEVQLPAPPVYGATTDVGSTCLQPASSEDAIPYAKQLDRPADGPSSVPMSYGLGKPRRIITRARVIHD